MVNVGLSWSSIVGIALAVSGAGLYFLRTLRPGLARDHDIFFAAVGLLCGGILFFQGWRQDPILQFGQFMLAGTTIWFALETIRLRGVATEQAKRTTPVVDDERPVSRVYRAELDELAAVDERPATRRLRSTRDSRSAQVDEYGEEYGEEVRRRPSSSRSSSGSDRSGLGNERPRKRRPRPEGRPPERNESSSVWDDDLPEERSSRSASSASRPSTGPSSSAARSRRSRPASDSSPASDLSKSSRRRAESKTSPNNYVDYQPVDYSEDDGDSSRRFE